MTILYPVAETAEAALHEPRGRAVRAREAGAVAGAQVAFVTESVGPAFATREAALQAYAGRGLADAETTLGVGEETQWLRLVPVAPDDAPAGRARAPQDQPPAGRAVALVSPTHRAGRRWPEPRPSAGVRWRLSISYWRIEAAAAPDLERVASDAAARTLRRGGSGSGLGGPALNALARQPLRPVKPQQPLDIGLFETRLPESPEIIVPDD